MFPGRVHRDARHCGERARREREGERETKSVSTKGMRERKTAAGWWKTTKREKGWGRGDARLCFIVDTFFGVTRREPGVVVGGVVKGFMLGLLALVATACCAASSMFLPRGPASTRKEKKKKKRAQIRISRDNNDDDEKEIGRRRMKCKSGGGGG